MQDSYHPDLGRHPNRHMTLAKPEKAFAYVGCEAPRFGTVNPVVGLNCQQLAWGVTRRKKSFFLCRLQLVLSALWKTWISQY
jgi:hypothetical protein